MEKSRRNGRLFYLEMRVGVTGIYQRIRTKTMRIRGRTYVVSLRGLHKDQI